MCKCSPFIDSQHSVRPFRRVISQLTFLCLASLSDVLAIIFGVTTIILGIGQIIVTFLGRRRSQLQGVCLSVGEYNLRMKANT
jgi:hypothetical protein